MIKIYLHAKDPYGAKYQMLINKRESTGLKYLNDPKVFIKYSNDMDDIYKNIEEYNSNKKRMLDFMNLYKKYCKTIFFFSY